ncbi:hypothetical protein K438DRAFT_1971011 [Mycena galopus ATCC 62051]|nr:hypothetical protein K438DRAFT_1971011 [Mycena galopus ATCC 62051]
MSIGGKPPPPYTLSSLIVYSHVSFASDDDEEDAEEYEASFINDDEAEDEQPIQWSRSPSVVQSTPGGKSNKGNVTYVFYLARITNVSITPPRHQTGTYSAFDHPRSFQDRPFESIGRAHVSPPSPEFRLLITETILSQ